MKKILVSAIIIVTFVGYFWFQQQSLLATDIIPNISASPTATPTKIPIKTSTPQVSGFKNGTYTSQVGDVYGHGNLQFQVVIQGGKISDIQFSQYPTNGSTSRQISNYSLPTLRQEAIRAQNANVDIVSGATETSQVFAQLLNGILGGIKI